MPDHGKPRRCAAVASLSPPDAEELLDARATLESPNARLAAQRHDPAALEQVSDIVAQGTAAVAAGRIKIWRA